MKKQALIIFLVLMGGILQIPFIGSANQTITITNTHNDGFNINGYYSTTSGSLKLCNPYYDCYSYLLFWRVDANASALEEAILSIYCIPQADNATEKYVTIYGLEDPNMSTCFNEPSGVPYTDAYVNLQVNTGWSGWKNITVTDIVRELMSLSTWRNNKNIPFAILGASGYVNEIEIYDYSSGTGNSAILYIETYDDPSEKPYNGGWDHGVWVNGTDEYDIWTVWNGTKTQGWISCNDNSTDHLNIYDSSYTVTDLTSLGVPMNFGISSMQYAVCYINGTGYIPIIFDEATDWLGIYRIDNATSLTLIKKLDETSIGGYLNPFARYKADDNQIWVFIYSGSNWFYYTYDFDTDTVVDGGLTGFQTMLDVAISEDGSHIYLVGEYYSSNIKYGWKKYETGVGWSSINNLATADFSAMGMNYYTVGSEVHIYVLIKDANADARGYYMDSDETWTSLETILSSTSINRPLVVYMPSEELIKVFWSCTTDTPDSVYYRVRTGGLVPSWGSITELFDADATSYYGVGQILLDNSFYWAFGGSGATDFTNIDFGAPSTPFGGLDMENTQPFLIDSLSANYTQLHYINCTWTDPYVGPYIPPPDEEPYYNPDPLSFGSWYGLIGLMGMFVSIGLFYGRAQNGDITGIAYALVVFVASFAIFYGWVISF